MNPEHVESGGSSPGSRASSSPARKAKNGVYSGQGVVSQEVINGEVVEHIRGIETTAGTKLERRLEARHISMIAMGGAIGTGLLLGSGKALEQGGPASIFISFSLVGIIVWLVMTALGEICTWLPMSAGFTGYATRFCDPSLGFALGWTYYLKYALQPAQQLTSAALVIQFWLPADRVNPGVWIAILLVIIIGINYFGVRLFGEVEFYLSAFKVIVMIGVILVTLIIAAGGADGHPRGFEYYRNPGAFAPYLEKGSLGKFAGFWSTLVTAVFAFLGTELVGVTGAEAANPRRSIPRAMKLTFFRIAFFYIASIFLVGLCVPYNSQQLAFANKATANANASPFVVAMRLAHIQVLPHILNAAILVFVFSAANSDVYIATRTLYGLASVGDAPAIFRRTDKRGVPVNALAVSAVVGLIGFLNVSTASKNVFTYLINVVTILGLLAWISILITHISFVRARRAQGVTDKQMPYVAPFGLWGSSVALFVCILICITKNFDALVPNIYSQAKYSEFITGYIGIPVYLGLLFGHKLITKSKRVKAHECDLFTGKDIIDREEEEYIAREESEKAASGPQSFYKRWVSWLF
ncbi:amino acid permease [Xylariaceae sp. FL0255]|nr:amino acid permease [Xylariaceae sp. FL0255]